MPLRRPYLPLFALFAALILFACAPAPVRPASPPGNGGLARPPLQATPTPQSDGLRALTQSSLDTEEQIRNTYLPPSDPLELARRLNGVQQLPVPPTAPERQWQIGDESTFWIDNLDTDQSFQVQASLRAMTDHVYMWVESGYDVDEDGLRRSAEVFETHTYPIVHETFGTEWTPGIDGDPRLYILHATNMGGGVAAYFGSESEYPHEAASASNEHEIFYVNLDTMATSIGTEYYDGVLAHEFQHMVHWYRDANEDSWLNEGFSELAALLTGFDRRGFAEQFLRLPATQLNAWPEDEGHAQHYGASFMFVTYFHERFGDEATQKLVLDPANGLESIDNTLHALNITDPHSGQSVTATDLFADWTVANLLNDTQIMDGRYGYAMLDVLPTPTISQIVSTYPFEQMAGASPQYSAQYVQLEHNGPQRVRLLFKGASLVRIVPTDDPDGQRLWYSNRGDTSDATLTRAFDLRGVDTATLEFATWYDIESLWDYAYVMVSADDGASWTILPTEHTTDDDPHHNAYGPGYTGRSNQFAPDGWLQEQADLSPFAGQEVLVRFEMITDEATNQPGMVIDDVRIPELGYAEDFEAGPGGWSAEGWLYMDNVLPQRWLVQLVVQNEQGTQVTRLVSPDDPAYGSWEFEIGGAAGEVKLVISPLAPLTTERGQFSYRVSLVE